MGDLIQDTMFGKVVRFATKGKYLQYSEERDPSLWKQYLDRQVALQDTTRPSQAISDSEGLDDEHSQSLDAEKSLDGSDANPDLENGSDVLLITWFGPNDPDVCIRPSPLQN